MQTKVFIGNFLNFYFCTKEELPKFASNLFAMPMLIFIVFLFVLAIVSPKVFPNKKVSKHQKDWEV